VQAATERVSEIETRCQTEAGRNRLRAAAAIARQGRNPAPVPVPGATNPRFTLRTIDSTQRTYGIVMAVDGMSEVADVRVTAPTVVAKRLAEMEHAVSVRVGEAAGIGVTVTARRVAAGAGVAVRAAVGAEVVDAVVVAERCNPRS
jgi:hypothetical protein